MGIYGYVRHLSLLVIGSETAPFSEPRGGLCMHLVPAMTCSHEALASSHLRMSGLGNVSFGRWSETRRAEAEAATCNSPSCGSVRDCGNGYRHHLFLSTSHAVKQIELRRARRDNGWMPTSGGVPQVGAKNVLNKYSGRAGHSCLSGLLLPSPKGESFER